MGLIGVYKLAYDYDRKCSLIKERDIAYDANFCVKEAQVNRNQHILQIMVIYFVQFHVWERYNNSDTITPP